MQIVSRIFKTRETIFFAKIPNSFPRLSFLWHRLGCPDGCFDERPHTGQPGGGIDMVRHRGSTWNSRESHNFAFNTGRRGRSFGNEEGWMQFSYLLHSCCLRRDVNLGVRALVFHHPSLEIGRRRSPFLHRLREKSWVASENLDEKKRNTLDLWLMYHAVCCNSIYKCTISPPFSAADMSVIPWANKKINMHSNTVVISLRYGCAVYTLHDPYGS